MVQEGPGRSGGLAGSGRVLEDLVKYKRVWEGWGGSWSIREQGGIFFLASCEPG